jgi:hypothetical protein
MTDLDELIATLERTQEEHRAQGTASSEEVKALLRSATSHLEAARVNGNGNGSGPVGPADGGAEPGYDDIHQSLDKVRRIVSDLKEGRY